jgi:hypothetical protein
MAIFGIPAALIVLALAGPAQRAPSPEEQKAFVEGVRLFDTGDARGAERVWKSGYAAGHDPAFLIRIGEAQEKAGAPKEAVQSYEQYLRESPDAADRPDIEARVARLAPPSAAKAAPDGEIPGEMGGSGGPSGAGGPATVPPSTGSAQPAPEIAPARQTADNEHDDLVPIADDPGPRSGLNTAAWVSAGVTTALLGVAAFFGASAADKSGDANRLLLYADQNSGVPNEYAQNAKQYEDDVRIGRRNDRIAKEFLIAAGATAVIATVLFILDPAPAKGRERVQANAADRNRRPSKSAATLTLTGVSPTGLSWSF